jgi:3-dehydroquinate dehydratase, type I
MSMGALGAISRVAAVFGSALTFAVVPDEEGRLGASAPGQLPIDEVRRCLSLLGGR